MLRFPFTTRLSPDIDQKLRERIATAVEGITTFHSHSRIKDLRHSGRDIDSVREADVDAGYSLWRHKDEGKRVRTGFSFDGVSYRAASDREQAHTGKAWIAFATSCEDGADVREGLPLLVRMTRHAKAARMTTVDGREAAVHRFAFDGLADIEDPRAQKIVAWLRDHRVNGQTLVVTTGADDGELLGLQMRTRSMTTCTRNPLYCRSRTDLHSFGQPVGPRPDVPPDDQVYWFPDNNPPRHG